MTRPTKEELSQALFEMPVRLRQVMYSELNALEKERKGYLSALKYYANPNAWATGMGPKVAQEALDEYAKN